MHVSYFNFIRIFICSAVFLISYVNTAMAQTDEFSGWGAWFHTQRFSTHWGASFDGQFRSANHVDYLKNVLLRPSINYYFGNKSATLGYAYVSTNGRTATGGKTFREENRIFEQFIITQKAGVNTAITHRFRLEQRFLGSTPTQQEVFSQRVRYFIR
jgi:predicted Zn-dependent protease